MTIINTAKTTVETEKGTFVALSRDVAKYETVSRTKLASQIASLHGEKLGNHSEATWPVYWSANYSKHTLVVVLAAMLHPLDKRF